VVVVRGGAETRGEDGPHPGPTADWQGWSACAAAVAGFLLCLLAGGASLSLPWASSLDLRLSFALDGLAVLYGLSATGVGALVFAYGTAT
jgi:multicomponent Na+:H+ antiporter subunit A